MKAHIRLFVLMNTWGVRPDRKLGTALRWIERTPNVSLTYSKRYMGDPSHLPGCRGNSLIDDREKGNPFGNIHMRSWPSWKRLHTAQ